jgi:hypothetical protein
MPGLIMGNCDPMVGIAIRLHWSAEFPMVPF